MEYDLDVDRLNCPACGRRQGYMFLRHAEGKRATPPGILRLGERGYRFVRQGKEIDHSPRAAVCVQCSHKTLLPEMDQERDWRKRIQRIFAQEKSQRRARGAIQSI